MPFREKSAWISLLSMCGICGVYTPKEANASRDERDKLIELKATRIAYFGLAAGVALACLFGAFSPAIILNTNALLFIFVTAEVLRSGCQIIQYRRSA
jgi:hypothetical protein